MKNLIILAIGPWYPNTFFRYISDAFERMGHTVIRFGADYNNPYDIQWADECQVSIHCSFPKESNWNLDQCVDFCTQYWQTPDLLVVTEETYHNEIVTTHKIPMILYATDGWPENFERVEVYQPTIAYMEDPLGIRAYPRKEQDPRWRFMPGAAAPWVHRDLQIPRIYDFYFCGTMYVNRPILCEFLSNKGFNVRYGKADTPTYVHNLSSAIATLHDCNQEDRVKWRLFEGMACGCTVISDYTQLLDWLGYKPWEHYVPCIDSICHQGEPAPDMWEMQKRLQWIKDHPQESQRISNNGKSHTLNNHTYFNRAATTLSDLRSLNIF